MASSKKAKSKKAKAKKPKAKDILQQAMQDAGCEVFKGPGGCLGCRFQGNIFEFTAQTMVQAHDISKEIPLSDIAAAICSFEWSRGDLLFPKVRYKRPRR